MWFFNEGPRRHICPVIANCRIIHTFLHLFKLFYMKKLLFALPVLALSLVFMFCNKSNVQEETGAVKTDVGAADRGPVTCDISVVADNIQPLVFCGIDPTSSQACNSCTSTTPNKRGVQTINGAGVVTVTANYTFAVINNNNVGIWFNLSTGSSQTGYVYIPAGGCIEYTVDDNCNF